MIPPTMIPTYDDDDCGDEHKGGWYSKGQGVAGVLAKAFNILRRFE